MAVWMPSKDAIQATSHKPPSSSVIVVRSSHTRDTSHHEPSDSGWVDEGQTNSVLFDFLSGRQTWYQNEPADSGWVDEGQTNSVLFDLGICLAVKRGKYPNEPADSGWVDEGQTNSVLFDLSVWPSIVVPKRASGQWMGRPFLP